LTEESALTLRIALLGTPRVEVAGSPLVVDTRKAIALLAYLAVASRPIARDLLADLLWPEADPVGGRGALRRTLSVLRSGLGGRWLQADRRQVALAADDVSIDVADFRVGVMDAPHAHAGGAACPSCRVRLSSAVELYRGDFLEGFALRDSPAFDAWQLLESEALRGELAAALRRLAPFEAAEGRRAAAIAAGRRLLTLDPLDEASHRLLIRLHAGAGDRAAAARQYRECVRLLEAELGVSPAAETTSLYESLMTAPVPAPAARGLSPDARRFLSAAAILGDDPDPDLAQEVSGLGESAVLAAVEELCERGLLREPSPDEAALVYRFVDTSARSAALEALGLAARRQLHRRAGRALAARLEGRAPDATLAARAADHLAAAGLEAEAAALRVLAGEAAQRVSAHGQAAAQYRAALALGHPEQVGLYEALGDVETLRGRYGEALVAYEAGAALAPAERVAGFEQRLGQLHLRRGALELADLHLSAALDRPGASGGALRGRLLADRSLVALRRDDTETAARLARAALRAARRSGDLEAESQAENLLAMVARRAGDPAGARRHLGRSLTQATAARHAPAQVAALNNLALLERSVGDLERALELAEEALRRSVAVGDRHREAALRNNRADLLHALGRRAEAEEELTRAVTAFAEIGERQGPEPEIWKLVEW
jgi:DNA-binding SARP family transcriptional activator